MGQTSRVSGRATSVFFDGRYHVVAYHGTPVVRFNDEEIILNTGGWFTATTKTRMNQASNQYNLGYQVSQDNFDWFITYKGRKMPFIGEQVVLRR